MYQLEMYQMRAIKSKKSKIFMWKLEIGVWTIGLLRKAFWSQMAQNFFFFFWPHNPRLRYFFKIGFNIWFWTTWSFLCENGSLASRDFFILGYIKFWINQVLSYKIRECLFPETFKTTIKNTIWSAILDVSFLQVLPKKAPFLEH